MVMLVVMLPPIIIIVITLQWYENASKLIPTSIQELLLGYVWIKVGNISLEIAIHIPKFWLAT